MERRERFEEMMRRVRELAPFVNGEQARTALQDVMRAVEDEFSGIPEDPDAHLARTSDGRMYPPHDKYEIPSGSGRIRAFRQIGHRTFFGENGALLIERLDGTSELDLSGADGKRITDLRSETKSDAH
jgi:hypothetical protein